MHGPETPQSVPMPRPYVRLFSIELWCLACGSEVGVLRTNRWPLFGPFLFQQDGTERHIPIADWTQLRCVSCSGSPYIDGVRSRRVYPRLRPEDLDVPKRGRPPKWLVAQRQAAGSNGAE